VRIQGAKAEAFPKLGLGVSSGDSTLAKQAQLILR
jgi:hypothetical protein